MDAIYIMPSIQVDAPGIRLSIKNVIDCKIIACYFKFGDGWKKKKKKETKKKKP
jgi:hypothetical protein